MTFIMENNQTWYNYICSRSLTETAFFFIYRKTPWTKSCRETSKVLWFSLQRSLELLKEAKVVLEVVAKVANLPLEHCDTLHTHTESEAAVLLAVDS